MSLLDKTLVVAMGEFGRTPGDLTGNKGREHYAKAMVGLFAGAGVQGGRAMGATDSEAAKVVDFGWRRKRLYPEDVCATAAGFWAVTRPIMSGRLRERSSFRFTGRKRLQTYTSDIRSPPPSP